MMNLKRLDWIIEKAMLAESRLSDAERKFIDDMHNRRSRFGDKTKVSDAQEAWLEAISEKTS